uniref:Galactosylgalactosylxylosylprotein 3-beta-glucuronosyltransferase n=1 Tax=Equus caballus TaxID=9796 RepID=A0A9L0SEV8_HORSE
ARTCTCPRRGATSGPGCRAPRSSATPAWPGCASGTGTSARSPACSSSPTTTTPTVWSSSRRCEQRARSLSGRWAWLAGDATNDPWWRTAKSLAGTRAGEQTGPLPSTWQSLVSTRSSKTRPLHRIPSRHSARPLQGEGGSGFAVSLQVILSNPKAVFKRHGSQPGMQESDFLKQITTVEELEPKASNCTKVLVWHTRTEKVNLANEPKYHLDTVKIEV